MISIKPLKVSRLPEDLSISRASSTPFLAAGLKFPSLKHPSYWIMITEAMNDGMGAPEKQRRGKK